MNMTKPTTQMTQPPATSAMIITVLEDVLAALALPVAALEDVAESDEESVAVVLLPLVDVLGLTVPGVEDDPDEDTVVLVRLPDALLEPVTLDVGVGVGVSVDVELPLPVAEADEDAGAVVVGVGVISVSADTIVIVSKTMYSSALMSSVESPGSWTRPTMMYEPSVVIVNELSSSSLVLSLSKAPLADPPVPAGAPARLVPQLVPAVQAHMSDVTTAPGRPVVESMALGKMPLVTPEATDAVQETVNVVDTWNWVESSERLTPTGQRPALLTSSESNESEPALPPLPTPMQ